MVRGFFQKSTHERLSAEAGQKAPAELPEPARTPSSLRGCSSWSHGWSWLATPLPAGTHEAQAAARPTYINTGTGETARLSV